ncbi:hypothetical protein EB796_018701 [Bugula neritina]|uniref:tRNA/rRNA methyltransferase SpoU type domain-containing protein n=1 Tax=Bugula neritina TaxID=10212 RepID=A0A7J7JBI6_BUGNE|nr:hypothetical protein EB796_018701 [Bugula neritina]
MILTHCPAGQTTSQLKVKFLHEILEQLADIVESDDISMGKRAGRLLHLVWSVVDDEALSRIDGVLCGVDEKGVRSSCTYLILTCICDLLLKENRFMKSFWHLLVEGMKSKEGVIRKQCIYMVKTVLDAYDKNLLEVSDCPLMNFQADIRETTLNVWSHYILFMECLNEKQYHIVQPNFTRLEHILPAVGEGVIHIRWLLALLSRLLAHDNMQVKRFAVLYVLNLDYHQHRVFLSHQPLAALSKDFIVMANQSAFFTRRPDQREAVIPEVFRAMRSYLTCVVSALGDDNSKATFLKGVIHTLASSPWCPVPCMYWLAALSSLNHPSYKGCWDEQSLAVIVDMMGNHLLLSDKRVRNATCYYLLTAVTNLCQINGSTIDLFCILLTQLRADDIVKYGSKQWEAVKVSLQVEIEIGNLSLDSLLTSACKEEIALLLLPLTSEADTDLTVVSWLSRSCGEILSTCGDRAYVSQSSVEQALRSVTLVHHILFSGVSHCSEQRTEEMLRGSLEELQTFISGVASSSCEYLLSLLQQKAVVAEDVKGTVLKFVELLSANGKLTHHSLSLADKICTKALSNMAEMSDLEWRLLNTVMSSSTLPSHLYNQLYLYRPDVSIGYRPGLHEQYTKWLVNYWYLQSVSPPTLDWMQWYSEATDSLSVMYRDDSCVVFQCLYIILPQLKTGAVGDAADSMLAKIEEESNNSHYLPLVTSLVECVFSVRLLQREEVWPNLSKVFNVLYTRAEEKPGVANILSRQIHRVVCSHSVTVSLLSHWLVQLAMFGPIHNKAHRTVEDAFTFLEETGVLTEAKLSAGEKRVGWDISDHEVRVLAVDSAICLCENSFDLYATLHDILGEISQAYHSLLAVKCYSNFPNAVSHRQRHRLLCLLLSLLSFAAKETKIQTELLSFLKSGLQKELQPSCRHQLEWVFIYLMRTSPQLIGTWLIEQMEPGLASYVCSMFCIASHVCEHQVNDSSHLQQLDIIQSILPLITPWGMSSKFHMRIHAQATLLKIWQHAKDCGLREELSYSFPLLKANMEFAMLSGTATEKNSRKLLENFFYFKFDAVKDWSLEAIFSLWPRLLSMANGEGIPYCLFGQKTKQAVQEQCFHTVLRTYNETESDFTEIQRKITTWRTINPSLDCLEEFPANQSIRKDGLILVTSLIEKLPNLGGLCRTAEIFGVQEMIVNNLKLIQDANFLSTSVTAHQWISMKQVPAHCLPQYLSAMREEYDYTIVALEQTTNSKPLTHYDMPAKTLLLLGNEKEGIPAELIQLADVCVEIPQQGIIRSLNVHVSGALLIWEYRKQRLFEQEVSATTS